MEINKSNAFCVLKQDSHIYLFFFSAKSLGKVGFYRRRVGRKAWNPGVKLTNILRATFSYKIVVPAFL
jgi:hypothetical protein